MPFITGLGTVFFGLTVGWIAYRILRLRVGAFAGFSDLIAILWVMGGAAVLALFGINVLFGWYAIGLALGFFAYVALGIRFYGTREVQPWSSVQVSPTPKPQEVPPLVMEQPPTTPIPDNQPEAASES